MRPMSAKDTIASPHMARDSDGRCLLPDRKVARTANHAARNLLADFLLGGPDHDELLQLLKQPSGIVARDVDRLPPSFCFCERAK